MTPEEKSQKLDEKIRFITATGHAPRWLVVAMGLVIVANLVGSTAQYLTLRQLSATTCQSTEDLKRGARDTALASIIGDEAFLKAHQGEGTKDFPAAVVNADIAKYRHVVKLNAPSAC